MLTWTTFQRSPLRSIREPCLGSDLSPSMSRSLSSVVGSPLYRNTSCLARLMLHFLPRRDGRPCALILSDAFLRERVAFPHVRQGVGNPYSAIGRPQGPPRPKLATEPTFHECQAPETRGLRRSPDHSRHRVSALAD